MDVNNMKVTDLKKELKSRGLSIVGNKSELIARLASALDTSSQSLDVNHGSHIEDSALEDQLLGDDSVADTSLSTKTDDHLIDDLLDANETKAGTTIKVVSKTAVSGNSISKGTLSPTKTIVTNPSSPTKSTSDSEAKQDSTANVKTTTAVKVLSAEERKQLRAQKFGDNKLTERAARFGIKPEVDSTANKTIIDEKLQKRAQRFGAISSKVKQMDVNEKLVKRAERFAISSNNNNKTTTNTTTTTEITGPQKRKITFDSGKETDKKQQRLARFGKFL